MKQGQVPSLKAGVLGELGTETRAPTAARSAHFLVPLGSPGPSRGSASAAGQCHALRIPGRGAVDTPARNSPRTGRQQATLPVLPTLCDLNHSCGQVHLLWREGNSPASWAEFLQPPGLDFVPELVHIQQDSEFTTPERDARHTPKPRRL